MKELRIKVLKQCLPGRRKWDRPNWTWLQGINEIMREKRLIVGGCEGRNSWRMRINCKQNWRKKMWKHYTNNLNNNNNKKKKNK